MPKIEKDEPFDWIDATSYNIKYDAKAQNYINNLQPKVYTPQLYSQFDETYSTNACTLYGPLTIMSTISGIKQSADYEKNMFAYAKQFGMPPYIEGKSNNAGNGARMAIKFRNLKNPDNQFVFFQDYLGSDIVNTALSKGIPIQVWIQGTAKRNIESKKGQLISEDMGLVTWRHVLACRKVGDIYEFLDSNTRSYRCEKPLFDSLIASKRIMLPCRIFLPLEKIGGLSEEDYKLLQNYMKINSSLRNRFTDPEFRQALANINGFLRANL